MSPAEERFRNLVRGLLKLGIYPGPTAINTIRGKQGKMNVLGTDMARWRREELVAAGFTRQNGAGRRAKHPKRVWNPQFGRPGMKHCRRCGRVSLA